MATGVFACEQSGLTCVNSSTDMTGHYALVLSPGTWALSANPPGGDTTDATTNVTITVNTSGTVTTCTGAGCTGTPPPVNIKLQVANVIGTVHESNGTVAANAGISVCPQGGNTCSDTMTDSTGGYRLALSPGNWTLKVDPPSGDTADSTTSVLVTVSPAGVATKCTGAGCTGTPPPVNIKLQVPSISGKVTTGTSPLAGVCVAAYPVGAQLRRLRRHRRRRDVRDPVPEAGALRRRLLLDRVRRVLPRRELPHAMVEEQDVEMECHSRAVTAGTTTATIDATAALLGGTSRAPSPRRPPRHPSPTSA